MQNYFTDIGRWYEMGSRERGKKMNGAQMHLALELKCSDWYEILTEQHITNASSSLNQVKRKIQELAENERINRTNGESGDANISNNGIFRSTGTQNNQDLNGNVRDAVGRYEKISIFYNRNAPRICIPDRYVHVIEDILKEDPLKKPKFVIHESLQRLGVENFEALGHDGPIILQNLCLSKILKTFT